MLALRENDCRCDTETNRTKYEYDELGNMTCKAATSASGCSGGTAMVYPTPGPGVARPHAPLTIDDLAASYDAAGNLTGYGSNSFQYNKLGQLTFGQEDGSGEAYGYDGTGRLNQADSLRYIPTPDFEYNKASSIWRIHTTLGGVTINTKTRAYSPGGGGGGGCAAALPAEGEASWTNLGSHFAPGFAAVLILWIQVLLTRPGRRRRLEAAAAVGMATVFFVATAVPYPLWNPFLRQAQAAPVDGLYYHGGHLGSTLLVTDVNGVVVQRVRYRPYGELVQPAVGGSEVAPEFAFTGQQFFKNSGVYYYGARWYNPVLGRFVQPDSVVPNPENPQAFNRYAYVYNNPLNLVDPSGNFPDVFGGIGDFFGSVGGFVSDYVFAPVADFAYGFGSSLAYSVGIGGAPSGSGYGYDIGAWLGGAVGIAGGLALDAVATPFLAAGDVLGAVPVIGSQLAAPFNAAGNALYNYAADVATRGDSFSRTNWTVLSPFTTDVGATGFGLLGNITGVTEAIGTTVGAILGLDPAQASEIPSSWVSALIPRHGIFSGPGHPREALFDQAQATFNTGPDIGARPHDRAYREEFAGQIAADRQLVQYLDSGNTPVPGPVTFVYQNLMREAFRIKADQGWQF